MIPLRALCSPAGRLGLRGHPVAGGAFLRRPAASACPTRATAFQPRWTPSLPQRAWESSKSSKSEEETCGYIGAGPNESILFFDNLFPLKLVNFVARPWQSDRNVEDLLKRFENSSLGIMDPINLVKRAIPKSVPMKVTEIVPRLKDGGAFVKFSHPPEITASEIEGTVAKILEEHPIKPWFNPFRGIKVGLVNGVPWLEDLMRFPKARLRVEFCSKEPGHEAVELPQETLYTLFRRYGKIIDITPQPFDSKVVPKYAYVDFALIRDAIMARNCNHGLIVQEGSGGGKAGTKLRLSYEQRVKAHHTWDWATNHPRIIIPLLAALIAAVTVAIFDPIREFFIKAHVQRSFKLSNSRLYKWFKRQTSDILSFRPHAGEAAGMSALFTHRKDVIDQVQTWLMETADTFIVVQGPRGSGKRELIMEQALGGRKDVLVIDCKPIVEARGESGTIKKMAAEVGYRPVFGWANNLSSLIDLAVQSTTGVKAGFSETLDSQLAKILQTTAAALKEVSLADHHKRDPKDSDLSDDAYLEAHPERRAVVVIDNFLHRNEDGSIVSEKIADWAAAMVQSNIAHVIFLTNDSSYSKSLSKSLPDRVFRQVALGDLSPEIAKKFVVGHLDSADAVDTDESEDGSSAAEERRPPGDTQRRRDLCELDDCIDVLGGRLTDLEFLARRLKTGQSPKRAVSEIIEQSASEILKMFLLATSAPSPGEGDRRWSVEQAWYLVKEMAAKESLRYNEVLLSNTFTSSTTPGASSGEAALEGLASAELITVTSHRGRPQTIRPGRPVYQAAFGMLTGDAALAARMDLAVLAELAKVEAKNIDKAEAELSLLGSLPRQPAQTADRVRYLLAKLQGSHAKIAEYEAQMAGMKKTLSQEA